MIIPLAIDFYDTRSRFWMEQRLTDGAWSKLDFRFLAILKAAIGRG